MRACGSSPAFWISTYVFAGVKIWTRRSRSAAASASRDYSSAFETRPERHPESAISPFEWLWSSSQSTRGL
jgi:hypothetical protein